LGQTQGKESNMRDYELIYVIQPDLDEATLESVVDRVNELVKTNKGEIVKTDKWGKRKLAYPIRKLNEGNYFFSLIKLEPEADSELKRSLKYVEQIIRFSILRAK